MAEFLISPINPIRFVNSAQISTNFDKVLGVNMFNRLHEKRPYLQKWQTGDATTIQILSDFPDIVCRVINIDTGAVEAGPLAVEIETEVLQQTFKVYELGFDFSVYTEGCYYAVIEYTNELEEVVTLESEPFEVKEEHEGTLLIKYRNTENNFSVIFDTGVTFNIRVEGDVENFKPQSDDVVYNDQKRNATLLSSTPYRVFTLFIGSAAGVPNWMGDKINRATSCEMIDINGEYYQKTEGSTWDVQRVDEYAFLGMSVEIMPVENKYLNRYKTGNGPGEVTIVDKIDNLRDIGGDTTISDLFKNETLLEKICIVRTGAPFNLFLGTTPGGKEIGEFQVVELVQTLNINYLFTGPTPVYVWGVSAVSLFSIIYKQLDEKPIPTGLGGGTPNAFGSVGIRATLIYSPVSAEALDIDFNLTTGLGNAGTDWEGWAIADGRNSTDDYGDVFPMGYKNGVREIGSTGGANSATISNANLPEHDHKTAIDGTANTANLQAGNSIAKNRTSGGNSNANLGGIVGTPDIGLTSKAGSATPTPISTLNKFKTVLWVTKIS